MSWFSPAHLCSPTASLSPALEVALACATVQAPCKLCLVLLSQLRCTGCPYEGSWELPAELLVERGAGMFLHHISHLISRPPGTLFSQYGWDLEAGLGSESAPCPWHFPTAFQRVLVNCLKHKK